MAITPFLHPFANELFRRFVLAVTPTHIANAATQTDENQHVLVIGGVNEITPSIVVRIK